MHSDDDRNRRGGIWKPSNPLECIDKDLRMCVCVCVSALTHKCAGDGLTGVVPTVNNQNNVTTTFFYFGTSASLLTSLAHDTCPDWTILFIVPRGWMSTKLKGFTHLADLCQWLRADIRGWCVMNPINPKVWPYHCTLEKQQQQQINETFLVFIWILISFLKSDQSCRCSSLSVLVLIYCTIVWVLCISESVALCVFFFFSGRAITN